MLDGSPRALIDFTAAAPVLVFICVWLQLLKGDVAFDILLGQDGLARSHPAQHRDAGRLGGGGQGERAGLVPVFDQIARLLQIFEMAVDGGGGAQPHRRADFPHGGGISLGLVKLLDEGQDFLMHGREFFHVFHLVTAAESIVLFIIPQRTGKCKHLFENYPAAQSVTFWKKTGRSRLTITGETDIIYYDIFWCMISCNGMLYR